MMCEISEEVVRGVAQICGPHSAAAKALENAAARRAAGETVRFFKTGYGSLIVHGATAEDAAGGL